MYHYDNHDGRVKVIETKDCVEIYLDGDLTISLDHGTTNEELNKEIAEMMRLDKLGY